MELEVIIENLTKNYKNLQSVIKNLKEIFRLDKNRIDNIYKLKNKLTKFDKLITNLDMTDNNILNLKEWLNQYKLILEDTTDQIKRKFGSELEEQLNKFGLKLFGQYPYLKTSFFTIELNFDKQKAKIWYGSMQELLDECKLTAKEILNNIIKLRKELGSKLSEKELLENLYNAYLRVKKEEEIEQVPIINVLYEMSFLLQDRKFREDPRKDYYKSYNRADFSYDLYRIKEYQSKNTLQYNLCLRVATREFTKQRYNFLWVPDNESDKGTTYSHLYFKEVLKNVSTEP